MLFINKLITVILIIFASLIISCRSESLKRKIVNASIETTKGNIEIELYESDAPKTVANFIGLAQQGYFNGIIFHRVSKGFVVQTGDSTGTGYGGRSIYGGMFEDELDPSTPSYKEGYKRGVIAMANSGPNTNLSQFFIVLQDAPSLAKNFTIFGKVTNGMNVVDSIANVDVYPVFSSIDGKPKTEVRIKRIVILK